MRCTTHKGDSHRHSFVVVLRYPTSFVRAPRPASHAFSFLFSSSFFRDPQAPAHEDSLIFFLTLLKGFYPLSTSLDIDDTNRADLRSLISFVLANGPKSRNPLLASPSTVGSTQLPGASSSTPVVLALVHVQCQLVRVLRCSKFRSNA